MKIYYIKVNSVRGQKNKIIMGNYFTITSLITSLAKMYNLTEAENRTRNKNKEKIQRLKLFFSLFTMAFNDVN